VEGDERHRLFVALPLPDDTVERLVRWGLAALADASDARLVPPQNLHVTLAFLGSRPAGELEAIVGELGEAAHAAEPPVLTAEGYRETRAVGMVVLADEDGRAGRLAADVAERLARIGVYRPEGRPWLPHVTVLRFRRRPRLAPAAPDLGRVSPSDAALYTSVLRRTGAQYAIRDAFPLGG
jgi:RNA 2',3'-cyclic 3'-phosphodiesterase